MLTMIEPGEVPGNGRHREKSARRVFANETLAEFMEAAGPGEFAEVTGFEGVDGGTGVEQMASALRSEAFPMGLRDRVSVMRRGDRLFLRRAKPAPSRRAGRL